MARRNALFKSGGRFLVVVALMTVCAVCGCRNKSADETPDDTKPTSSAVFKDITSETKLDFVHYNGETGNLTLPEITGSGGALFDYDNDGDLDLYVVQGAVLDPNAAASAKAPANLRDRLYENTPGEDGVPIFKDVTADSRINALGYGMGVAAGDFNNDGWIDLYVTNLGPNQLLRNNGDGTFTDMTKQRNADDPRWSTSATFVDFDRDGWLDLFVTNYVQFSLDLKRECFANSSARDYCGPDVYEDAGDRLFHNRGDGSFEDVTAAAGLAGKFGAGLGVVAADFNDDGWTDIYVTNDGDPNQLWINQQGKGFVDDELAGASVNRKGQPEAGMGVDAGDFDGDGDEDLFMTHIEAESNTLYVNDGQGMFDDETVASGLEVPSLGYTAFGTGFIDYDNDGWLDLLVLNGAVRIIEDLARKGDPYPLHQPNQLYRNVGQSAFVDATKSAGEDFGKSFVSRGGAFGDIDNDGDTDVVVFNNSGPVRILRNEIGSLQHWLGLRLLDGEHDRDSHHARVEVKLSDEKSLWRRVRADGSYCSANDPRVLCGLADHSGKVTIRVHWPDGRVEEWADLEIDCYLTLRQGQSPDVE